MITLCNPTGRNTPAHVVGLEDGTQLFFSYETCIAKESPDGTQQRLANVWGPTTGRHFNEMGLAHWPIVESIE